MWVHSMMNSWLAVQTDEGTVQILSNQWRIFFMCASYSKTDWPVMDSKEARLHWRTNKWASISHE